MAGKLRAANASATATAPSLTLIVGTVCIALHLALNSGYGIFRDELYFIVCGLHPDYGYVDQPPLTPLIAGLSYRLFGLNLLALRLAPALAMSATVALSATMARALSGGVFAQALAGLATLFAPVLLVQGMLMSTDFLQPLSWLGLSFCLLQLAQGRDERWWLAVGAIIGVSAESKYLILFYVVALAPDVLLTPLRRSLARPWIYAGAALALAIAAPNIIWQARHGWPFLELAAVGATQKNVQLSPLGLLGQFALFLGPPTAPIWLAGLWFLARRRELAAIPIAVAALFALVLATHGKAYYLTSIGPALFAAGAVAIERWRPPASWLRWPLFASVGVSGVVTLPLSLPILPPTQLNSYQGALRLGSAASQTERGPRAELPQYFADMFGWRDMAEAVTKVFDALPEEDRQRAVFFGRNYGEAAAMALYGGPPAISGHNQYAFWGPGDADGSVVITINDKRTGIARLYDNVEEIGRLNNAYAVPFERDAPILLLRSPRLSLREAWPQLKHFD